MGQVEVSTVPVVHKGGEVCVQVRSSGVYVPGPDIFHQKEGGKGDPEREGEEPVGKVDARDEHDDGHEVKVLSLDNVRDAEAAGIDHPHRHGNKRKPEGGQVVPHRGVRYVGQHPDHRLLANNAVGEGVDTAGNETAHRGGEHEAAAYIRVPRGDRDKGEAQDGADHVAGGVLGETHQLQPYTGDQKEGGEGGNDRGAEEESTCEMQRGEGIDEGDEEALAQGEAVPEMREEEPEPGRPQREEDELEERAGHHQQSKGSPQEPGDDEESPDDS
mmetsp:Transcript_3565/g.9711  ORF Transcript_3565/g.9711 Transcript_3565/m.9711 type:complete len:273 (+) Transcript_3565:82-900(+)